MKRNVALVVLLAVAFVAYAWVNPARALTGQLPSAAMGTYESTAVVAGKSQFISYLGNGNTIYGFSVFASSANAWGALYDADTKSDVTPQTKELAQGVYIDEGGEATQFDTWVSDWPAPYRLTQGLYVESVAGTVTVRHDVVS